MALGSNDITLGSGSLYLYPANANVWANWVNNNISASTIENEQYRYGHISGGSTLTYEPTFLTVKDDLELVSYTGLQEENISFKSGVMTWDANSLNKITTTGAVTVVNNNAVFDIGGLSHYQQPSYLARFVSQDNKKRVDMCPSITGGWEIAFQKDSATVIDLQFTCDPLPGLDGRKVRFTQAINAS